LTTVRTQAGGPLRLGDSAWAVLGERIEAAHRRAQRERRPVLASVTGPVPADVDLSAAVLAARRAGDRYFCLEEPDRDAFVLTGLGEAALTEATGEDRFRAVAAACRELARGALVGRDSADPASPPGAGPVWVGGFAFAPRGGAAPEWGSLAPAQLVLPEISLARRGDEARMTVSAMVEGDESADAILDRLRARVESLEPVPMPLFDPDPLESARVAGAAPPEHFESAVAQAVERIRAGEIEKVVLAREVRVHAPHEIDPAPVLDALRAAFPACYCYLVGTPDCAFIGASPELLVRRDGARAQTVALAGTTRRSADPSVDDLLGEQLLRGAKNREEQAIVTRRIERTLRPVSVWVAAADEPVLVKVQNVQHLATPIRAQLADPVPCVELAGMLHPTPAVGGEPRDDAARLIPALEGLDRGWYAGTVGWTDLSDDGEFCVAIRCALLRGSVAHLYAGNGIVRDSDPADELAETEVKLQALLPLLA
jgi:salicylate biosynthesis isochorismate synthase/menaquinone-specific isochorismate synthase